MKAEKFPVTITEKGVSAIIRESTKFKDGKKHRYFIVEYILLGKRKQVWRSGLAAAASMSVRHPRTRRMGGSILQAERANFTPHNVNQLIRVPKRVPNC
jgi:hypothetical protein